MILYSLLNCIYKTNIIQNRPPFMINARNTDNSFVMDAIKKRTIPIIPLKRRGDNNCFQKGLMEHLKVTLYIHT